MKNYLAPVLIVLVAVSLLGYHRFSTSPAHIDVLQTEATTTTDVEAHEASGVTSNQGTTTPTQTTHAAYNARIVVGNTAYPIVVTSHESLLEAMLQLEKGSSFTFSGRDYPGLGFFVDAINGVAHGGGKYWVYYINGTSATEGVSSTILTPGDQIVWKYEAAK